MDAVIRGTIAPAGFFACVGLQSINSFISLIVGITTLVFLILSIYKLIKDIK